MALQQPRPRESLAAHGAHVRQGVRQQVHRQGRHRDVSFSAGGTGAGASRLQTAVRLLVTRQVGRRGVRLAALAAHVAAGTRRTGRGGSGFLADRGRFAAFGRARLAGRRRVATFGASIADEESFVRVGNCFAGFGCGRGFAWRRIAVTVVGRNRTGR